MTTIAAPSTAAGGTTVHYRRPGWFTRNVANRAVARLTRMGISVWGSRVLEVRGRKSGQPRRNPVNVLSLDDRRYLVSARGEGEWVRNARAADGSVALLLGRHREDVHIVELTDDDKVPVLRAYLARWKAEVGVFFDGIDADSSDAEIAAIAHRHPVFVIDGAVAA
jgi:deazaflavin-dependent oxidoreductase (nitroreductase family)